MCPSLQCRSYVVLGLGRMYGYASVLTSVVVGFVVVTHEHHAVLAALSL